MTDTQFSQLPKGTVVRQHPMFLDALGMLLPVEFPDLPFVPKRIFIVCNVPPSGIRGGHAHHTTRQYLLCLQGKIRVLLFDGIEKREFLLTQGQGTLVDALVWDRQQFLTGDDVLLVFSSTNYNPADYIASEKEFKKITHGSRKRTSQ